MDSQIRFFTWFAGSGRPISLRLTLDDAESCAHPGQCDSDVDDLLLSGPIAPQVSTWDPETLRDELAEYGAWEDDALGDHDENIRRMIWLACCDVAENPKDYEEE